MTLFPINSWPRLYRRWPKMVVRENMRPDLCKLMVRSDVITFGGPNFIHWKLCNRELLDYHLLQSFAIYWFCSLNCLSIFHFTLNLHLKVSPNSLWGQNVNFIDISLYDTTTTTTTPTTSRGFHFLLLFIFKLLCLFPLFLKIFLFYWNFRKFVKLLPSLFI